MWEWSNHPQSYVPLEDVDVPLLIAEEHEQRLQFGVTRRHGLRTVGQQRTGSVRICGADALAGVAGHARFNWAALDAWHEEDERVFVHSRPLTCGLTPSAGIAKLAESTSPVLVFETGLPTRHFIDRTDVRFEHLLHTPTEAACPYRDLTSDYSDQARAGLEPVIRKSSESFREVQGEGRMFPGRPETN